MAYMGFLDDCPLHAFCAVASPALGFSAFIVHAMKSVFILCLALVLGDAGRLSFASGAVGGAPLNGMLDFK
jgi:hypothetical protein